MTRITAVLFIVAATVLTVAILAFRRKRGWGFKDVLKNPEYWKRASGVFEKTRRAVSRATSWSDEEVRIAVTTFLFDVPSSHAAWAEGRVLESLAPRTFDSIISILADSNLRQKLITPTGQAYVPEAPFNRACKLLGRAPPPTAVDVVAPFLDAEEKGIRQDAAFVLGKIATPSVVPHLRRAFVERGAVSEYALMGLEYAVTDQRFSSTVGNALFDDIKRLVLTSKVGAKGPRLLLAADQAAAVSFLLSDEILSPDFAAVYHVLAALAEQRVSVTRERLRVLIMGLESKEMKYPYSDALREALHLLGQQRHEADLPFLEERTGHANEEVAKGAALGLLASHGLDGFKEKLRKMLDERGWSALTTPQRHFAAVSILAGQVGNGGFSQYFVNSSGDTWCDALDGLAAMELSQRRDILKDAALVFGKDGPPSDRAQRQEALARLVRRNEDAFETFDNRWQASSEVINVFSVRYVLSNPDQFAEGTQITEPQLP